MTASRSGQVSWLFALACAVAGCGGDGGGGGPKVHASGTHVVEGTCDLSGDGVDTHRVRPDAGGTLTATLTWDETGDADLDLTLWAHEDGDLVIVGADWASPPGDSPAEMSEAVEEGVRYEVDVECLSDSDGESYEVTLTVP